MDRWLVVFNQSEEYACRKYGWKTINVRNAQPDNMAWEEQSFVEHSDFGGLHVEIS